MIKKRLLALITSGVLLLSGCGKTEEPATGLNVPETAMRDSVPTVEEISAELATTHPEYTFEVLSSYGDDKSITIHYKVTPPIGNIHTYSYYANNGLVHELHNLNLDIEFGAAMMQLAPYFPEDTLFTTDGSALYTKEDLTLQQIKTAYYDCVDFSSEFKNFPDIISGLSEELYNSLAERAVDCGGIMVLLEDENTDDFLSNCALNEGVKRVIINYDTHFSYALSTADGTYCAVTEKTSDVLIYETKVIDGVEMLMEYQPNTEYGSYVPWQDNYKLSWGEIAPKIT